MVLQKKGKPAGSANAGNSRWWKGKCNPVSKTGQLLVYAQLNCLILFLGLLSFLPRLQGNKEEGAVGVLHNAEQAEPDDSRRVFDAGYFTENLFDLACG